MFIWILNWEKQLLEIVSEELLVMNVFSQNPSTNETTYLYSNYRYLRFDISRVTNFTETLRCNNYEESHYYELLRKGAWTWKIIEGIEGYCAWTLWNLHVVRIDARGAVNATPTSKNYASEVSTLGTPQNSTKSKCNEMASIWGNRLNDHG